MCLTCQICLEVNGYGFLLCHGRGGTEGAEF
jgi:hypothetical protein